MVVNSTRRPLLIAGTGAMACLYGALLAPHAEVTLLGTWPAGLKAIRDQGIRLQRNGLETVLDVQAISDTGACPQVDLALVLVKSWQTERAARQLRGCLTPHGIALTLQNGLGNVETLRAELGEHRASLGITTTGATLLGPGHVRLGGMGPTYLPDDPRLEPLGRMLRQAGFEVGFERDLDALVWKKLAINSGINPLTALLNTSNGGLLDRQDSRQVMIAAAEETCLVARNLRVDLAGWDAGEAIEDVARKTAKNISSMLQDIRRGAPTEIDAINGAVVQQGKITSTATPVNWTLWHLVRAQVGLLSGGRE